MCLRGLNRRRFNASSIVIVCSVISGFGAESIVDCFAPGSWPGLVGDSVCPRQIPTASITSAPTNIFRIGDPPQDLNYRSEPAARAADFVLACALEPSRCRILVPIMDREIAQRLIHELEAAANAHDTTRVMRLYADDAVLVSPVWGELCGRDAIAQTWDRTFELYPD